MRRLLIGGLGNVLLGDDGVGPYLTRLLAAHYQFESGVELADLGTPALDLIEYIGGRDAVILIDSLKSDAAPGAIQIFRQQDLICRCPSLRQDTHSGALVETLLSIDLFGITPPHLLLVGIVGKSYTPGCSLSAAVIRSLDGAAAEVLRQLDRLGIKYQRRMCPLDPGIWWTHQLPGSACA